MGVFPVGFETEEWVEAFLKENPHYLNISSKTMLEWAENSDVKPVGKGLCFEDDGKAVANIMRNRNMVFTMHDLLTESNRSICLNRFLGYKKICKVLLDNTDKAINNFNDVSIPTAEEGFDQIDFPLKTKEEIDTIMTEW